MDHETAAALRELRERLARIERQLGLAPWGDADHPKESPSTPIALIPPDTPADFRSADESGCAPRPTPPPADSPPPPPSHKPTLSGIPIGPPPPLPTWQTQPGESKLPVFTRWRKRRATHDEQDSQRSEPPSRPDSIAAAARRDGLEKWFAERWLAWVGSLVVVLAVGFFVRLAYEEGWVGRLPDPLKAILAAGFGGLLIAAGEWALRQAGRIASVGLFGAGVGVLYLTAFSTFRYFHLTNESGAFVLMLIAALIGLGISLRARMLTIAVLSVVAGHLTPILLSSAASFPAALPLYLTFLLAISLGLSAWDGVTFRSLRYVAMGGHALLAMAWLATEGADAPLLAITFLALCWGLLTAETVYAALRGQSPRGNAVASLLNTAFLATFGCWILSRQGYVIDPSPLFAIVIAVVAAGIAWRLGDGLRVWRDPLLSSAEKLALALWTQTGVLVAVSIALQFNGYGQTIGWLAVGLAAIELGRRLPSRGTDIFGLLVIAAAILRLLTFDRLDNALHHQLLALDKLTIDHWSILALGVILALQAAARRICCPGKPAWPDAPSMLAVAGVAGWMLLCLQQAAGVFVTAGWILGAALLIAFEHAGRVQNYLRIGAMLLAAATLRWLVFDTTSERLDPQWDALAASPVLNLQFTAALVIAVLAWWTGRKFEQRVADGTPTMTGGLTAALITAAAGLLVLLGASFEIDRAIERISHQATTWAPWHVKHMMWTALWAAGGLILGLWVGRPREGEGPGHAVLRRLAWTLLLLSAAKWLLFDTLAWRFMLGAERWIAARPVANLQMLVGLWLAGVTGVLLWRIGAPRPPMRLGWKWLAAARPERLLTLIGAVLVLWGLSFELDRAIAIWEQGGGRAAWSAEMLRILWVTPLWALGGFTLTLVGSRRHMPEFAIGGGAILLAAAGVWLTIGTLLPRVFHGVTPAPPVLNLQTLTGLGVFALLAGAWWSATRVGDHPGWRSHLAAWVPWAGGGLLAFGWWVGSLELDRYFAPQAGRYAEAARLTALSVYWGLYAIGLVALGFVRHAPIVRYAGLGLLSLTAAKVLIIDLSEARYIYRVASLLITGLLLIATSVAYARISRAAGERDSSPWEPDSDPGSPGVVPVRDASEPDNN